MKGVERPERLEGPTFCVRLDDGRPLFVTVNEMDGRPVEVFVRIDDPELFEWITVLTLMISRALRCGESLETIAEDLMQIHSPRTNHFHRGHRFPSLAARIGTVLAGYAEACTATTV